MKRRALESLDEAEDVFRIGGDVDVVENDRRVVVVEEHVQRIAERVYGCIGLYLPDLLLRHSFK